MVPFSDVLADDYVIQLLYLNEIYIDRFVLHYVINLLDLSFKCTLIRLFIMCTTIDDIYLHGSFSLSD
ncbi:hypothetical protein Y032_0152g2886 [Ancylostoma ceylanicum]|uniref:Uncharacterized protein n=1 Tax=Ancylostoma ceylanicum TaxID=53326 RepID=A0A016T0J6_9BILA|nr:hypothetical protein Y032_0152g2886 [Ancylostoma ceylanicum]